jgi:hypothetical protein
MTPTASLPRARTQNITVRNCDICGNSDKFEVLGTRKYEVVRRKAIFEFEFEDTMCGSCGFVFQRKLPDEDFLIDYYVQGYTTKTAFANSLPVFDSENRLAVLRRYLPQGASILEIGAGDGEFCRVMQKSGFVATGFDPLDVEGSDSHVTRSAIGEKKFNPSGKFDAAVTYFVPEHVRNTRQWLGEIKSLIAPNGILVVEVPDFSKFPAESLVHEHMSHFTPEHLSSLFKSAGFEVLSVGTPPSRYFGLVGVGRAQAGTPSSSVHFGEHMTANARTYYAAGRAEQKKHDEITNNVAQHVTRLIEQRGRNNVEAYCWGVNEYSTKIAEDLRNLTGIEVQPIDNAVSKIGTVQFGFSRPVAAPAFPKHSPKHRIIVICSPRWNEAIRQQIREMDLDDLSVVDGVEGIHKGA